MKKQEIVDLITKCYNKLENIETGLDEANQTVKEVISILEEMPSEVEQIEDDEEEEDEK